MNGYKYYDGVVRRLSIFNRIDRQLESSILHKLMELMVYQYSKTVDVCVLTKHTLISYWFLQVSLWYLLRHSRTHHAGYRMFAETDFVQSAFKRIRGGNGSDKEYAPFFLFWSISIDLIDCVWTYQLVDSDGRSTPFLSLPLDVHWRWTYHVFTSLKLLFLQNCSANYIFL